MRRKKRAQKIKLRKLEWILLGVMAVALVMLSVTLWGYAADRSAHEKARALAVTTPTATVAYTLPPAATPSPTPLPTPPVTVDFDAIREEGMHVRGWLYCADSLIHYPVTYYSNNSYYLDHDYTGKRSKAGALFFDTRVTKALAGDNLIIYGHHMKDNSMFGSLLQYQKQAYYDAHPVMYLLTLDGNYRIDLMAGRFTDSDAQNHPIWFADEQARKTYVERAMANSDFTPADAEYRPGARMITLVTCAYSNYVEDAKYQVLGWLTPIG